MADEKDQMCDHCGSSITEEELNDCVEDEFGYCVLCGYQISEHEDGED